MNKIVGAIDFEEVEMKLRKQQVEVMGSGSPPVGD
jgi:hypothetical protein